MKKLTLLLSLFALLSACSKEDITPEILHGKWRHTQLEEMFKFDEFTFHADGSYLKIQEGTNREEGRYEIIKTNGSKMELRMKTRGLFNVSYKIKVQRTGKKTIFVQDPLGSSNTFVKVR